MNTNRYNLGIDLEYGTPEYIEFWDECRIEGRRRGRRLEEYYTVRERNLGSEEGVLRLKEAYGLTEDSYRDPYISDCAFVTDDVDLASELIRVLGLDFVHDFKSGLFMFDLFGGHEIVMSCIAEASLNKGFKAYKDGGEAFLEKGLGCYMSSQYKTIWFGEDVALPQWAKPFKNQIKRF